MWIFNHKRVADIARGESVEKVKSKFKNESEKSSILLLSQWLHQDMTQVNGVVPSPFKVDWCPNRRFFIFSPKAKKVRFYFLGSIRPWMEMGPHLWHRQCPHVAIDPIWNRTIVGFISKNELKHFVCRSAPSRHGRPRTGPEPSADTVGPEPARAERKQYSQNGVFIHTFVKKCEYLFTLLWISVNIYSQSGVSTHKRLGAVSLKY